MNSDYLPTIGLETHVQLKTKTKLFSAVDNDASHATPNSLISHIDVGMPGALPYLNEAAVDLSAKAAFALGTRPQEFSKFDRKHYFYPDLPKGYQITQYDQPLIKGGRVEIEVDSQKKTINITRAHLEEDAGKNIHPEGADYSLVDLNRAGTPLIEIVSEPEIHSANEAKIFARELWLIMKYAGVTDGDLFHGHLRFDVNVSVSRDPSKPGIRTEIKNLNSFRSIENALTYEIKRQIEILEHGEQVIQETRGWDEAKQKTTSQRQKEEAQDYRYMPEPDIPPLELDDEYIERIHARLSKLPNDLRSELSRLSIDRQVIEDVLDRSEIVPRILQVLHKSSPEDARLVVFQLLEDPKNLMLELDDQLKICQMINSSQLSSTAAKEALADLRAAKSLEEATGSRLQLSDENEIEKIVAEVIKQNTKVVEDIKAGQEKAIGFLVGQVMQKTAGKANPQVAQHIIKKQIDNL